MRNANILSKLENIDADILVLTETNSCIDLSKSYQTHIPSACLFESLSIGTGPYGQGENRVTIWSKFPGQRRGDMCNSHSAVCALLNCGDWGELNVYGTILGIYGKNRGSHEPQLPKTDFETAVEIQTIDWERIARLGPLCIVGDFNTQLSSNANYYVSPSGREKINDCLNQLEIDVPTRHMPDNIDHIALSKTFLANFDPNPKWELWNKAKDKKLLSDHMGVCVTLKRSEQ
jgi:hypothetical protein